MRKLIVTSVPTVDGDYEGEDKSIDSLVQYRHRSYVNVDSFDRYNAGRLRASDVLLLSRSSFLSNKAFWPTWNRTC